MWFLYGFILIASPITINFRPPRGGPTPRAHTAPPQQRASTPAMPESAAWPQRARPDPGPWRRAWPGTPAVECRALECPWPQKGMHMPGMVSNHAHSHTYGSQGRSRKRETHSVSRATKHGLMCMSSSRGTVVESRTTSKPIWLWGVRARLTLAQLGPELCRMKVGGQSQGLELVSGRFRK